MVIPKEILDKWKELRSHGDGKKIALENPDRINEMDFSRALNSGECSDEVFEIIGNFFNKKIERIKQFL